MHFSNVKDICKDQMLSVDIIKLEVHIFELTFSRWCRIAGGLSGHASWSKLGSTNISKGSNSLSFSIAFSTTTLEIVLCEPFAVGTCCPKLSWMLFSIGSGAIGVSPCQAFFLEYHCCPLVVHSEHLQHYTLVRMTVLGFIVAILILP